MLPSEQCLHGTSFSAALGPPHAIDEASLDLSTTTHQPKPPSPASLTRTLTHSHGCMSPQAHPPCCVVRMHACMYVQLQWQRPTGRPLAASGHRSDSAALDPTPPPQRCKTPTTHTPSHRNIGTSGPSTQRLSERAGPHQQPNQRQRHRRVFRVNLRSDAARSARSRVASPGGCTARDGLAAVTGALRPKTQPKQYRKRIRAPAPAIVSGLPARRSLVSSEGPGAGACCTGGASRSACMYARMPTHRLPTVCAARVATGTTPWLPEQPRHIRVREVLLEDLLQVLHLRRKVRGHVGDVHGVDRGDDGTRRC